MLFGVSKKIDGTLLLKHSDEYYYLEKSEDCVIGQWPSRISNYREIFGNVPDELENNVAELDKLRNLRNKVGHAFGRDIEESRKKGIRKIHPISRVSLKRLKKILGIVHEVVVGIDKHLLNDHIGDFETVYLYHNLRPSLSEKMHNHEMAISLKKEIGAEDAQPASKGYCKELVNYYESL